MNSFGDILRLTVFGEAHSPAVGLILDKLPAGEEIDEELLSEELHRRPPGSTELGSANENPGDVVVSSGLMSGCTTGAPVCVLIRNPDSEASANKREVLRPGTSDLGAFIKYRGFSDYRGGGPFGVRLMAPVVVAGAICRQILEKRGITVSGKVVQIGAAKGDGMDLEMKKELLDARGSGDSVGSVAECRAEGIPAGTGGLMMDGLDSKIAAMLFALPGVKGVEFGAGFNIAAMKGSEANDPIRIQEERIYTETNHSGGVNGGISNGMPLVLRCAFRPTPSISREQQTVDVELMENVSTRLRGRQDPCMAPRAIPAVEAVMAFCILDAMMGDQFFSAADQLPGEDTP